MAVALLGLVGWPLGGTAALLVTLAMGAMFREDAFAAGALVAAPSAAVAIVWALTLSWMPFVLAVLFAPIAVFISGVLGRVGAALVGLTRRVDVPADAAPGSIAAVTAQAAVEQRRRGLVLVTLFVSFGIAAFAIDNRVNAAADRRARSVSQRLATATPAYRPDDLGQAKREVGALVTIRFGPQPAMVADASYAWATRCVVRELDGAGRVYTERSRSSVC